MTEVMSEKLLINAWKGKCWLELTHILHIVKHVKAEMEEQDEDVGDVPRQHSRGEPPVDLHSEPSHKPHLGSNKVACERVAAWGQYNL